MNDVKVGVAMTPAEQAEQARAEIKIRVIDNAVLVGTAGRWLAFGTWDEASKMIGARVKDLFSKRVQR